MVCVHLFASRKSLKACFGPHSGSSILGPRMMGPASQIAKQVPRSSQ